MKRTVVEVAAIGLLGVLASAFLAGPRLGLVLVPALIIIPPASIIPHRCVALGGGAFMNCYLYLLLFKITAIGAGIGLGVLLGVDSSVAAAAAITAVLVLSVAQAFSLARTAEKTA